MLSQVLQKAGCDPEQKQSLNRVSKSSSMSVWSVAKQYKREGSDGAFKPMGGGGAA